MARLKDVGLIGSGEYAPYVASDGDVVWCCLPRFDAEPGFAGLLDARHGGHFREASFEALSPPGLLSEDYDPKARRLGGNHPQAYSHVGPIHAAVDASPRWPEVL